MHKEFHRKFQREFHIHIDGIGLDQSHINTLQSGNFIIDDFEHSLTIKGEKIKPRHLSFIQKDSPLQSNIDKYEEAINFLLSKNFYGHIQLEMVCDAERIIGINPIYTKYNPPFLIESNRPKLYKTHELHLKLNYQVPYSLLKALIKTKMNYVLIGKNHYFTVSGEYLIVKNCYKLLIEWLYIYLPLNSIAEITFETTVKNKLFGMEVSGLPSVAVNLQ